MPPCTLAWTVLMLPPVARLSVLQPLLLGPVIPLTVRDITIVEYLTLALVFLGTVALSMLLTAGSFSAVLALMFTERADLLDDAESPPPATAAPRP